MRTRKESPWVAERVNASVCWARQARILVIATLALIGAGCGAPPPATELEVRQSAATSGLCQNVTCTALDQCHKAGTCNAATGVCSNPLKADGAACNDGNACTKNEVCTAGVCGNGTAVTCAAPDQCHVAAACSPTLGCVLTPKPDGTACNDSNACTQSDTCQAGTCVGQNPVVCAPPDQCHAAAGTCNKNTGVCSAPTNKPNGTACNDGNACTTTDACQSGNCKGTSPVKCAAADQCHVTGTCDPATGSCSQPTKTNGTACNDGNACTKNEVCTAGVCGNGSAVTCAAPDQCHLAAACSPALGCVLSAKPDGAACSDNNACTRSDTCQAGACVGQNPVICAPADQCHTVAGTCNKNTGFCSAPPNKPNGMACNDGNACTTTDACQAGICKGTNPVTCAAANQCHVAGTCDPTTGSCSQPAKPNGTACNDGNACTQSDICQTGTCTGSNPVTCAASDQCHAAGVCNTSTGVCPNPAKADGTSCSDGNACTQSDSCQAGTCTGSNPVTCSAGDQCHAAGVCDTSTGACSNPAKSDGTSCSDGNACTQSDTCQAGVCSGGSPVVCAASDQCHLAGTCDSTTGACSNPVAADGSACDDGNACTRADSCVAGACQSGAALSCDDGNVCTTDSCDPASGCGHAAFAHCGYTIEDLGTVGGEDTEAVAVNGVGRVVGRYGGFDGQLPGAFYVDAHSTNTSLTGIANPTGDYYRATDVAADGRISLGSNSIGAVLDPVTGVRWVAPPAILPAGRTYAAGINDVGLVLACADNGAVQQMFVWDLASGNTTLIPGSGSTCAGKISRAGMAVVNSSFSAGGLASLFDYADGTIETIPGFGGATTANDVNDAGTVAGSSLDGDFRDRAFVWHRGTTAARDIGTLGGSTAKALRIAADGTVVGFATTASEAIHAFLWREVGGMIDLGALPGDDTSVAIGINASGVIVGSSGRAWARHAVRWVRTLPAQCDQVADGAPCDDGDACTQADTCRAGRCVGGDLVICNAQDQCQVAGSCDSASGACTHPPQPDGTACTDGNACTTSDVCVRGTCAGTSVTCAASDACHLPGVCDVANGHCSNPAAPDSTSCPDGDLCNGVELCVGGQCQSGAPLSCDDQDPCTIDTCVPATGCSHPAAADGTTCSDGNPCNGPDRCSGGTCRSSGPLPATIPVDRPPRNLLLSADGSQLFATASDGSASELLIVDIGSRAVSQVIPLSLAAGTLTSSLDGQTIFVGHGYSGSNNFISVVPLISGAGTSEIDLGRGAYPGTDPILMAPSGILYSGRYPFGNLVAVEPASGQIVGQTPVGRPYGNAMTVSLDGTKLYLSHFTPQGGVTVYDITGGAPTHLSSLDFDVGAGANGLVFLSDSEAALVAWEEGAILRMNVTTKTVEASIPIAASRGIGGMALASDRQHLFVTDYQTNLLHEVDLSRNAIVSTYPTGAGPGSIAVAPGAEVVYVANSDGASVTIVTTCADGPPVAVLNITPQAGTPGPVHANVGQILSFDALGSRDVNTIVSFTYDFGDAVVVVRTDTHQVTHAYTAPGVYATRLVVRDSAGLSSSTISTVIVGP
jgi:probable HAF family extracellular repeat protein